LDIIFYVLAIDVSIFFTLESDYSFNSKLISLLGFILVQTLFRIFSDLYSISIRHSGIYTVKKILALLFISSCLGIIANFIVLDSTFIKTHLLTCLISLIFLSAYRVFLREFLYHERQSSAKKCIIYGAGNAGIEFLTASKQGNSYNVIGFIDDDNAQIGRNYHGIKVYSRDRLEHLINIYAVELVVLAIPSASRNKRKQILEFLLDKCIRVVSVPELSDLANNNSQITKTHDISVEELLGREPVSPNTKIISKNIANKIILVTGAGGSIGSELCRQLIQYNYSSLVLLDNHEPSLFSITEEIKNSGAKSYTSILCSILDTESLNKLFNTYKIDIVFHAAAYKHVPLVEDNALVAFNNNVIGTKNLLNVAVSYGCEAFTLISTDKAVRPTNLMGATKRLAELLCQSIGEKSSTKVSMVRFGNVIGSSGSVIPTFLKQISAGGPLTVTHPRIVRYFMTIPEAAQLVLQSSSITVGGDVFLLDMGEPVKILELAKRIIRLTGNTIADNSNTGGISIIFTGLRPGEKLYEELLVDSNSENTIHPRIFKANEKKLSQVDLNTIIDDCSKHLCSGDLLRYKKLLTHPAISYSENRQEDTPNLKFCNLSVKEISDINEEEKSTKTKNYEKSSLFLGSKFLTYLLHYYFRLRRGLTLGVRCIIVSDAKEILLIKHSYTDGWHLPGGGVEENESIQEALLREISEECNIRLQNEHYLLSVHYNYSVSQRDHVITFVSEDWKWLGNDSEKSFEVTDMQFFPINSLPVDLDQEASTCVQNWVENKHN